MQSVALSPALLAGVLAAAPLPAQEPALTEASGLGSADFMVPIHTAPADPIGGAYGVWALGPAYKVSFHDGFAFYPFLGADAPEHMPLRWRTRSVTAGGQPLFAPGTAPRHRASEWRYEYRYPGVVEAYDVRRDGVEQTFTLTRRPARPGDVVVVGEVRTPLRAAPADSAHASLTFTDPRSRAGVRYSEAWALDAAGRKAPVTTAFDGETIRLTVDGGWLARAAFPVTIDPVTKTVWLFGSPNPSYGPITRTDSETIRWMPGGHTMVVVHSRRFTAGDVDSFGQVMDEDFKNRRTIWSDVTTSWASDRPCVTVVHDANRWAIAVQRTFKNPTRSAIRVYGHRIGDGKLNGGRTMFLGLANGTTQRNPDIGGNHAFGRPQALVVYQLDKTSTNANTAHTEVLGVLADVKNHKFGTPFRLAGTAVGSTFDRERPSVSQFATAPVSDYWIVAWQELNRRIRGDDWDIYVARAENDGAGTYKGKGWVGPAGAGHKTLPMVDGYRDRYMIAYRRSTSLFGSAIEAQRFDWKDTASVPSKKTIRKIASGSVIGSNRVGLNAIAYDSSTKSHWAVAYTRGGKSLHVVRTGYTGGIVEHAVARTSPSGILAPSLSYTQDHDGFVLVSGVSGFLYPLHGQHFVYPEDAVNKPYGTGCKGKISAAKPYAGHEFFSVRLSGARPSVPAILMVSLAPGSIAFPPGSGCFFNLDVATFLTSWPRTTSSGFPPFGASVKLPLQDFPAAKGDLYFQWYHRDPAANAFGWVSTRGLKVQIR